MENIKKKEGRMKKRKIKIKERTPWRAVVWGRRRRDKKFGNKGRSRGRSLWRRLQKEPIGLSSLPRDVTQRGISTIRLNISENAVRRGGQISD